MFYLTTHSTHYIYGYMASDIIVKDHSDSERGNPLPPHWLLFPISSKGSFISIIPHTTTFVTPVVEHWLEREIASSDKTAFVLNADTFASKFHLKLLSKSSSDPSENTLLK